MGYEAGIRFGSEAILLGNESLYTFQVTDDVQNKTYHTVCLKSNLASWAVQHFGYSFHALDVDITGRARLVVTISCVRAVRHTVTSSTLSIGYIQTIIVISYDQLKYFLLSSLELCNIIQLLHSDKCNISFY